MKSPYDPTRRRDWAHNIYLHKDEYYLIKREATRRGQHVSVMIREIVMEKIREGKER